MTIRRLERTDWDQFCIRASWDFAGKATDIEIASLEIGFQLAARRLPLLGMSYDRRNDVLELLVGELEHLIHGPREMYVDEDPLGLIAFQIIDAEGRRQIITLREPLILPGPQPGLTRL